MPIPNSLFRGWSCWALLMLRMDLHVHTDHSDSKNSVQEVLREATAAGLDGLAITDHKTIQGALVASSLAGQNLLVIVGQEIKTTGGEILGYGLRHPVPDKLDLGEAVSEIHSQGGVAAVPHPTLPVLGIRSLDELAKAGVDAIEVVSALTPFPRRYMEKNRRLSSELGLPVVAGSDSHYRGTVGQTYTLLEAEERSLEAVLRSIENGRTSVVFHPSSRIQKLRAALGLPAALVRLALRLDS